MEPLTFPFTKDRFRHDLVQREGMICLIERTNLVTGSVHWEVIRLRQTTPYTFPSGRAVLAGERYPSPSEWGDHGWTYTAISDARHRYRNLVDAEAKKGGS
jgi:hypothetical protein